MTAMMRAAGAALTLFVCLTGVEGAPAEAQLPGDYRNQDIQNELMNMRQKMDREREALRQQMNQERDARQMEDMRRAHENRHR